MKITVYGGTNNKVYTDYQRSECEKLGAYLGKSGASVLTGACKGYPYFVGKGAIENGAKAVIGYTPAVNFDEHITKYNFPTDGVTELVYCAMPYATQAEAFIRRSLDMTPFSDVVIAMGGSWGTFAELIFSFIFKQTIILIEEFDGAVTAFNNAYDFFGARDVNPAVHNGARIVRVKNVDECIEYLVKLNQ